MFVLDLQMEVLISMMQSNNDKIKKLVLLSSLTAAAIILSIVESFIKIIPVPGAKIGLANLITILILYLYSFKEAFIVSLIRIILAGILSGNPGPTLAMGLLGGIISVIVMGLSKNLKLSIIVVSLLGSLSHQVGQIIAGIYVIGTSDIVYYLYIMLPLGVVTGIINGIIAKNFIFNIQKKQDIN